MGSMMEMVSDQAETAVVGEKGSRKKKNKPQFEWKAQWKHWQQKQCLEDTSIDKWITEFFKEFQDPQQLKIHIGNC